MGEAGLRGGLQVQAGDEGGRASKGLVGLKDSEGQTCMGMGGSVSQSTW